MGGGVAPWNIQQYQFKSNVSNWIEGKEKSSAKTFDLVFYHFQGVRFYSDNTVYLGNTKLTKDSIKIIYKLYLDILLEINEKVKILDDSFDGLGILPVSGSFFKRKLRNLKRKVNNRLITNLKFN